MNQKLKNSILAQYPEWHSQPFRLTLPEMQNPYTILEEFFDAYNLTQIRVLFREWLSNVIRTDEAPALNYISLHDQLERLIEAAWILHQSQKS
jgi:hypothetical protein